MSDRPARRTPAGAEAGQRRPRTVTVRAADGSVVAGQVSVADRFGSRLVGLMRRTGLDPDEGLWLLPCSSVQMFFMRTPLDVAYLDRQQKVVRCVPEMREWRFQLLPVRHAHSALELAPGVLARHGVREGDQLTFEAELADRVEPSLALAQSAPFSSSPGSSQ